MGRNAIKWSTVRQKDDSETGGERLQNRGQASNHIWGRNVATTRIPEKRIEIIEMRML